MPSREPAPADGRGGWGRRQTDFLPSVFVVLSLLALLVAPLIVQRQTEELRRDIEAGAEPGRTLVTAIQYYLARQTSALRGYLLTGNPSHLQRYRQFAEQERVALEKLDSLARGLGPEVVAAAAELRTLSKQWHSRLGEEAIVAARARPITGGDLPFEADLYLEALRAGNELDEALVEVAQERRTSIRRIEKWALAINVGLVLLALGAAISVIWLGRRVRNLALEAEGRRREAERALQAMGRTVESRAALIRGVTHDVKNPLGVADGYADLLEFGLKGDLTPDQAQIVHKIRRSIHDALDIIQDLLELSRAEGGGLPIAWQEVDLEEIAREVAEEYRAIVEASGHLLEVSDGVGLLRVRSDPDRVRQILGNLLNNAIKYTPVGGRISIRFLAEPGPSAPWPDAGVGVGVSDTGPGIPPEERERVFTEFHRIRGVTGSGHGLGLAISRRIARLLGGDIGLESEVGKGSLFVLWLPYDPPAQGRR